MKITPKNIAKLSKAFPEVGKHFDFKGPVVLQVHKDDVAFIGHNPAGELKEVIVRKEGWILATRFKSPGDLKDLMKIQDIMSRENIAPLVFLDESVDKVIQDVATRFIQQAMEMVK